MVCTSTCPVRRPSNISDNIRNRSTRKKEQRTCADTIVGQGNHHHHNQAALKASWCSLLEILWMSLSRRMWSHDSGLYADQQSRCGIPVYSAYCIQLMLSLQVFNIVWIFYMNTEEPIIIAYVQISWYSYVSEWRIAIKFSSVFFC